MKVKIVLKQLLNQLKTDLTGKDTLSGYTFTYSWMANQLGHFCMGFVLVFFLVWGVDTFAQQAPSWYYLATYLVASLVWVLMELRKTIIAINVQRSYGSFEPDTSFIWKDVIVDIAFFIYGTTIAYLGYMYNIWGIVAFVGLLIIYIFPAYHWLMRKMYYQQACFPKYMRLSEITKTFDSTVKTQIEDFSKNKGAIKVILIFGGMQAGKTALANAIAIEHAVKCNVTRYSTFLKFADLLMCRETYNRQKSNQIWPWHFSDILVVDDINSSSNHFELIKPQDVNDVLYTGALKDENMNFLKNMKSIWVCGGGNALQWKQLFGEIGFSESEILAICL